MSLRRGVYLFSSWRSLQSALNPLLTLLASVTALGVTAIALLSSRYGWRMQFELFSHFQVQYWLLTCLLAIALGFTRRRLGILIGLFCCVVLAIQILPWYLPPQRLLPHPVGNFRVLVANLNTQNHQYSQVVSLVRKERPDLAVFMEVDEAWVQELNTLNDVLPYSFGQANPYNLGLMVYSQQALIDPQIEFFGVEKNVSVVGQLAIAGQSLSVVATHPFAPVKPSFFRARNQQLDLVSQYIRASPKPVMLLGDLNLTMWSPYYKRLIRRTGLKNARQGFGIVPTWPTRKTFNQIPAFTTPLLSIPIDHCLLSPSLQVTNVRTGGDTGSDHRPLIVDLNVKKA